jgi:hypothetical protein
LLLAVPRPAEQPPRPPSAAQPAALQLQRARPRWAAPPAVPRPLAALLPPGDRLPPFFFFLRRRCRWLRGCGGCRQHTGRDGHPRGDTHPQGLKAGKRKAAAVQLGERGRPGGAPHTCKEHVGEGVRRQGAAAGPHWRAQALRDHERCAVVVRILCDWQACRLQEGCSGALQAAKGWRASQAQLCCVRLREPGLLADRNVHHVIPTGHREGRASQQEAQGCGFGGLKAAGLPGQHCGGPLWLVHVQGCMALQDHGVEAISEMADGHCVGCAGQLTQLLGRPVCWQEALGLREKQNGHFGPSAWTAHCLCAEWRCAGAVEGSKTANIGCGIEVGGQASCRRGWRPHCEAARVPHSTSVLKAAMGRPEAKGGSGGRTLLAGRVEARHCSAATRTAFPVARFYNAVGGQASGVLNRQRS